MSTKLPKNTTRMGRPPIPEEERAVTGSLRLTATRWQKLRRLGMDWLSRAIDRAKEPDRE